MIYLIDWIIESYPYNCKVLKQVTAPIDLPHKIMLLYPFSINLLKIYTKLANSYIIILLTVIHK